MSSDKMITISKEEYDMLNAAKARMDRYDECRRIRQRKYKRKARKNKEPK